MTAPTPTPTPPPPPPVAPPVAARGTLQFRVLPWTEVVIDGETVGTTPMKPLSLEAGEHMVVLNHPNYMPLIKGAGTVISLAFGIGFGFLPIYIALLV